jgi:hypothetical protein
MAVRLHRPFGEPHRDPHYDEKREGERDQGSKLAENRTVAGQCGHRSGVLADRNCGPRTMRRIAEVYPRQPGRCDGDCADGDIVILALEALEDRLHLRDRNKVIFAPETLGGRRDH